MTVVKNLVTAGAETDLTEGKPLRELVIQYIIDNWDTTFSKDLPPKQKVHFRLWFSGTPGLHIAVSDIHRTVNQRSLGNMPALIFCRGIVILDLFAMSVNCCQYPPELAAACAFIEKLIETQGDGLRPKGVERIQIYSAAEEREQDPTSSVFHYSIQVECIYVKSAIEYKAEEEGTEQLV